jgi:radical SAM superfamily enzyme YgiQ (UPF0313 family)
VKILLLFPKFPETFWSFKHVLRFIQKKSAFPPLGLLTVAALLPEKWTKRLVDLNVSGLTDEDLEWADWAFISSTRVQQASARHTISRCKKAGLKIVAGGPFFTSKYEKFKDVDHLVLNEAELTLPYFLSDLEKAHAKSVYETSEFCDLRKTPIPLWGLADLKQYSSMSIQFSRGCPFDCDFCNVTALFGHKPRIKTAEQVIGELDLLYNLGWREPVFFVDDNFIGNKSYLKSQLLPALIQWRKCKIGMPFYTQATINLADDDLLTEMMVAAGFYKVFIGIETPDKDSLAESNKTINQNRDLIRDVKKLQRNGLEVQGGFIVGFDSDTISIFQKQIDFIQKSGIVMAMVGLLEAAPGTRLYNRLKQERRLLNQGSGDNVDGTTNIIPIMGSDVLRDGYRDIVRYIYSTKNYYERVKVFLQECRVPNVSVPLDLQHTLAFFRINIRLGILDRERVQYWKMFIWTLIRRPKLIGRAVTLAAYGYHFRKVSELRTLLLR